MTMTNSLKIGLMLASLVLSACSIISVVDTAVDVALIPVKVGVAVVDVAIPDND